MDKPVCQALGPLSAHLYPRPIAVGSASTTSAWRRWTGALVNPPQPQHAVLNEALGHRYYLRCATPPSRQYQRV